MRAVCWYEAISDSDLLRKSTRNRQRQHKRALKTRCNKCVQISANKKTINCQLLVKSSVHKAPPPYVVRLMIYSKGLPSLRFGQGIVCGFLLIYKVAWPSVCLLGHTLYHRWRIRVKSMELQRSTRVYRTMEYIAIQYNIKQYNTTQYNRKKYYGEWKTTHYSIQCSTTQHNRKNYNRNNPIQ